jgi:hypothetical protein
LVSIETNGKKNIVDCFLKPSWAEEQGPEK